ncbi:hypothetical protein ARAF_0838 [Arsenophonus endosymbiont of Aleurodicus floccissimus]|uniref:hypothetical protein n=1 Tax=Arsenophonus endosymbiont of Aleurodicus floccissimus TaxID=2152761 RepID=UPI000E6B10B9|nr:hypothetical protein [Arsenophonus endosymbiont of Aleurodicus floccissimus]SPP31696.1 hypothetical protein ARAF_0838 [Arsenophonus endosymbiont of Aleurodicus floccissimus]
MGQVAFDTLQASEELEGAGISREQARAISLVVRKSHEVADVATKADIVEVNRNIADVRKDLSAEITNVSKDLSAEIADVRKDIAQIDKRLDFSEKRFDRLEQKFDRLQWFLLAGILGLLFKEIIPKLWGG